MMTAKSERVRWKRSVEEKILSRLSGWLVEALSSRGVNPDHLTFASLATAFVSSLAYYFSGRLEPLFYVAGLMLLVSGLLDALDGAVARRRGMETKAGAFLDSTLDKIGESAVFVSLVASGCVAPLWGSAGLASSILVSYTRSRAESLGVDLKGVGVMERAERILLITVASMLEPTFRGSINMAVVALTVLSSFTVAQRIRYSVTKLRESPL